MAPKAMNDLKRRAMAATLDRLRDRGWNFALLAVACDVTEGCVRNWERGKSMGTNVQRAALGRMGPPEEERPRLREIASAKRDEASNREALAQGAEELLRREIAEGHAPPDTTSIVARSHRRSRDRLLPRAVALESI